MSFLDHVRACNDHDLARFLPFRVDGAEVGWIAPTLAGRLADFPAVFVVGAQGIEKGIDLAPHLRGFEARSKALAGVARALAADGLIAHWRDESYSVATEFAAPALFTIERAAAARRAEWISVFVGMQPRLRHVPPKGPFSTTATLAPSRPAWAAAT